MSWKKVTLSDVSMNIQTGPFGSQLHQADYSVKGTPVVMPKDLIDGKISEESIARVEETHVNRLCRHKVEVGDIIYARRGDVGKCAFTTEREEGWLCGTGCLRVTVNPEIANPRFVFYQLQKPDTVGWVEKHAIGATMLNLNTSILRAVPIEIPTLEVQKKIVEEIKVYDDLIENNQKQIKLLEEAAQRLYKEWFVDLRFPNREKCKIVDGVPEGWENRTVGEVIEKPVRSKQIMTSNYQKSGLIPIIDQSRDFIAGYTNDAEALVEKDVPTIVFGDHTRVLKYIQFPFAKGADGTQLIISNCDEMPQSLLYCSLVNIDLSNYHYARHFKYLKAEKILVPTMEIANMFDKFCSEIFKEIQCKRNQIVKLTEARDRLLPKLMNGEIEI